MISFLEHVGVTIGLLIVATFLFEITTKNREFILIKNGNVTASLVLGGKIVGLAIVLESALRNSVSLLDLLTWGAIGILTQIIVYFVTDIVSTKVLKMSFFQQVENNNKAFGLAAFTFSIAVGYIVSGALTY